MNESVLTIAKKSLKHWIDSNRKYKERNHRASQQIQRAIEDYDPEKSVIKEYTYNNITITISCISTLDLSDLWLKDLPENIHIWLPGLSYLILTNNAFKKLPVSVTKFNRLEFLSLQDNYKLTVLPSDITKLTQLKVCNINGCRALTKLPENLSDMNLLVLSMCSTTNIKKLPDNFFNGFSKLQVLYIAENCPWKLNMPAKDLKRWKTIITYAQKKHVVQQA